MFKHTIKLAFRSYWRNKSTFFINLIGLSTGLACVLLIYLWVNDEWSIDKFHEKDAQLYQVFQNYKFPHGIDTWERTPLLLAHALEENFPEVETAIAVSSEEDSPEGIISHDDKSLMAKGAYVEDNYFEVFSYSIIAGDKRKIVKGKNSIAISEELALKLFNSTDIIGNNIHWKNQWEDDNFQITGVFKKPSTKSTIQFDFVMSLQYLWEDEHASKWTGDYAETYVILKEEVEVSKFNVQIAEFMKTQTNSREDATLFVQQYSKRYLYGNYENGQIAGGRIVYVRLFSIIALFILLIACINFMNLSTAQASTKMKEVGVKKTIGARRHSLITQFLVESVLMAFLSFLDALLIVKILLPQFNQITNKSLQLSFNSNDLLLLSVIVLMTGLLAGSYAAFYLSSFKPLNVLKGKLENSWNSQWIRKGLVVFQFTLSVIFIAGVFVIQQQMEFVQNKNLGYNKDNILSFERPDFRSDSEVFLSNIEQISGVVETASMFDNILSNASNQSGYSWREEESDQDYLFKSPIISYDLIETLGMELKQGRTFSRDFKNEQEKIIINETALKMMGLEQSIGQVVEYGHRDNKREIIGVVKDFHYGSIHHEVEPLIFRFTESANNVIVKVKAGTESTTIAALEKVFKKFHPDYPFDFAFLDTEYQALYESESRVAILSKYFSGLAILISCLGLLGLAMFTAERRKKEMSIRKVLGASIANIVGLLSKDFLKLVLIAFCIAIPIAHYFMQQWLQGFAYHISIHWSTFILTGLAVVGIALVTVSFQSIKTALANPIDSLKNE